MFSDAGHTSGNTFSADLHGACSGMLSTLRVMAAAIALLLPYAARRAQEAAHKVLALGT